MLNSFKSIFSVLYWAVFRLVLRCRGNLRRSPGVCCVNNRTSRGSFPVSPEAKVLSVTQCRVIVVAVGP